MENNYDEDQPMVCPHCEPQECTCLYEREETPFEYEDMDGDAQSALASAGMGTDEDYGSYADDPSRYDEDGDY